MPAEDAAAIEAALARLMLATEQVRIATEALRLALDQWLAVEEARAILSEARERR